MADRKNLCALIPTAMHDRVSQEREKLGMTNSDYVLKVLTEYYDMMENGGTNMKATEKGRERTLAFPVSEEFFQRVKRYLDRETKRTGRKLTQKDFVIGLIEAKLDEADQEDAASPPMRNPPQGSRRPSRARTAKPPRTASTPMRNPLRRSRRTARARTVRPPKTASTPMRNPLRRNRRTARARTAKPPRTASPPMRNPPRRNRRTRRTRTARPLRTASPPKQDPPRRNRRTARARTARPPRTTPNKTAGQSGTTKRAAWYGPRQGAVPDRFRRNAKGGKP